MNLRDLVRPRCEDAPPSVEILSLTVFAPNGATRIDGKQIVAHLTESRVVLAQTGETQTLWAGFPYVVEQRSADSRLAVPPNGLFVPV